LALTLRRIGILKDFCFKRNKIFGGKILAGKTTGGKKFGWKSLMTLGKRHKKG
jgi:hypothetical protein